MLSFRKLLTMKTSKVKSVISMTGILNTFAPIVLFVSLWEILSSGGNVALLPGPYVVLVDIARWFLSGDLLVDISASLNRVFWGFLFGFVFALISGVFAGSSRFIDSIIEPIVELLRPIPPLAWIPLSILWFGIGNSASSFLVSLGSFFPVYSGVRRGIADIQSSSIETARMFFSRSLSLRRYLQSLAARSSA
jgi:NitT/TauT family transport system permease protein